ncbi:MULTISPECIES: Tim44/TimA family putative adaptor protein [unclassified Methylobacterium]|uniref:Tim44/TimA family putative adaptor protein n=1 Tax=unclassified Methylobacterium TaxID=2615210 RepID=UPI0002DB5438|nr:MULTISPECIES: Tim44/TimA family putative adaptor protein [Methylobacterium]WFT83515.1 Tim44/TimA family putative adaptor protein [Methylobacterium nodulans]
MQDSLDLTTLIFLGLAVFVIWKLRAVLGQKTGHERPPFNPLVRRREEPPPAAREDNVVRLPAGGDRTAAAPVATVPRNWKGVVEPNSAAARGLDLVLQQEPGFDPRAFTDGAKIAYETIVMAFAKGDRRTLKSLLSREVAEGFERAIQARERAGQSVETTFVSIDRAEIVGVDLRNRVAQITVRYLSKLITATRNAQGAVVDGSPDTVVDVTDVWTFARTLGSRDPNWQLVATEAGQ